MTESLPTTEPGLGEDGQFQTGRVASIAAGHAVHDTYTAFLAPLLPTFVEKFALTNAAAGLLAAFLQLPSLLQPVIGHLADRTTIRWIVVLGPGITATAMSFLGWAPTYAALALVLLVAGLSVAAFHATAPVAVGYLSGNRLGRGMGFWMVGGEIGRTLGPLIIVSALAVMSLKQIGYLSIAGIATSAILYFRLRDVPLQTREHGEQVPWRTALRGMRSFMLVLGSLTVMRSMMMLATTVFLPLYLTESGSSIWLAGAALSIVEAAGVAGAFAGGWISDHVGRRAVLIFGQVTAPVALLLFLVADGWVRVAALPLIGFSLLAVPPVFMALAQEQAPRSRALANGLYLSMSMVIRSIAAVVYGAFADRFGLDTAMVMGAIAMFGGLPLVWLLFRPTVMPRTKR
ncbi:MAG: MFS transporter [Acidimicrobiia bacterium]|jgi:FSR family fosmidomycin resistance protein-like MFS transporter